MTDSSLIPPEPSRLDRVYGLVRAAISAVPTYGGPTAEILNLILGAPIEKRRDEWAWNVVDHVRRIEFRLPQRLRSLLEDPSFTGILTQATQAAFRANSADKLKLLSNAVGNAAAGINISSDLQSTFVRYVDELTASHIHVLDVMALNEKALSELRSWGVVYDVIVIQSSLKPSPDEFHLLASELQSRALIRVSRELEEFDDLAQGPARLTVEGHVEGPMLRVTDIGRKFLSFVRDPEESWSHRPPNER